MVVKHHQCCFGVDILVEYKATPSTLVHIGHLLCGVDKAPRAGIQHQHVGGSVDLGGEGQQCGPVVGQHRVQPPEVGLLRLVGLPVAVHVDSVRVLAGHGGTSPASHVVAPEPHVVVVVGAAPREPAGLHKRHVLRGSVVVGREHGLPVPFLEPALILGPD